jgi:4-hydroxyphenylpyruvate dioxygenase-like putative hemolysin
MSAREPWTQRLEQRQAQKEASASRGLSRTGAINAMDRCDRCGAQAYVRVLFNSRQELLFCAHHYRQHAPTLAKFAVNVQDETHRLTRCEWPGSRS